MADRIWRWPLAVAAWIVIIAGLRAGQSLLLPFLIAVLLAMVSFPLVRWLQQHRVPTALAVLLTVLVVLLGVSFVGLVVTVTAREFAALVPGYQARLTALLAEWMAYLEGRGVDTSQWLRMANPGAALDLVRMLFSGITAVLSNAFLVLLITSFILLEAASFGPKLRAALGMELEDVHWSHVTRDVHRYLWMKTLVSLATGFSIWVWAEVLGLDFAVLWGFLAFVLNYIPAFGSILASIPATLLALIQLGPLGALFMLIGFIVVNVVLGNIVEPQLLGRRLGLSPLVVLVSVIFWGWMWGPVGMLMAVPITMTVKIMLENVEGLRWVAVLMGRLRIPSKEEAAATAAAADKEASAETTAG
jgi:AI-2 transport protein TqsA